MSRFTAVLFFLMMLGGVAAEAQIYPGYMRQETPALTESMVRHRHVKLHGIPAKYREHKNPLTAAEENLREGAGIYGERCAQCHGERGHGEGPEGKGLNPPPSPLASTMRMGIATDPYLFWAIAEGGTELKTAMPAFKDVLGDEKIWKTVLYLRLRTWPTPAGK